MRLSNRESSSKELTPTPVTFPESTRSRPRSSVHCRPFKTQIRTHKNISIRYGNKLRGSLNTWSLMFLVLPEKFVIRNYLSLYRSFGPLTSLFMSSSSNRELLEGENNLIVSGGRPPPLNKRVNSGGFKRDPSVPSPDRSCEVSTFYFQERRRNN